MATSMRIRSIILLCFVTLLLASCEVEEFTPSAGEEELIETRGEQDEFSLLLDLVNDLRSEGCKCGSTSMPPVGKLSRHTNLDKAAGRHALDMQKNNFFDHTGSDGTDVSQRVTATGYNWQTVGENIAWGYQDIESVFLGWKDSPGHCRNMMNASFKHMGSAHSGKYWVQAFARPRSN